MSKFVRVCDLSKLLNRVRDTVVFQDYNRFNV